jgi:astacin
MLKGPGSADLYLSPLIVAAEPASPEDSAGETGRLLKPDPIPARRTSGGAQLLRFSAGGAAAYRLYFDNVALPDGARMFLYGLDAYGAVTSVFGPYENSGPVIHGSFRSRIIPGNEAVVELQGRGEGDWPFRITYVAAIDAMTLAELRSHGDPELSEHPSERKPVRGEKREVMVDGEPVTVEVRGNLAIREGDIVLGEATDLPGATDAGEKKDRSRSAFGYTTASRLWPEGIIPYVDEIRDGRIQAGVDYWNNRLAGFLTFVPKTTESEYVAFRAPVKYVLNSGQTGGFILEPVPVPVHHECSSDVGRRTGLPTFVWISPECSPRAVRHEIGHAVGLWHEATRKDRDQYVRINWENIRSGEEHNFAKVTSASATDLGHYDFGSIMHYGLKDFNNNDLPTIEPIVKTPAGVHIGGEWELSQGDINGVKAMYGIAANPADLFVYKEGGTFAIDVQTVGDRSWTARESASWLSIASGASGHGSGRILLRVAANKVAPVVAPVVSRSLLPGGIPLNQTPTRTATVTVALSSAKTVSVNVRQAAGDCTYSVSPKSLIVPTVGGVATLYVNAPSYCDWTVNAVLPWVRLDPDIHGRGSDTVSVKVIAIGGGRSGVITVAGEAIRIEQR